MVRRTEGEQALAEFKAAARAEFALKQRIERLRWERDELAPAVEEFNQLTVEGRTIETTLVEIEGS